MTKTLHIVLLSVLTAVIHLSCQRELYFDTIPPPPILPDSTLPANNAFPVCPGCINKEGYADNYWTMRVDTSLLCGRIDTAIINLERDAFTVYGPSECAQDSGLILTVYLKPLALNRDTTNMRIEKVSFFYYDTGSPYIFMSRTNSTFTLNIVEYDHQSRIAKASFEGYGYRQNGMASFINTGKFQVKLQ